MMEQYFQTHYCVDMMKIHRSLLKICEYHLIPIEDISMPLGTYQAYKWLSMGNANTCLGVSQIDNIDILNFYPWFGKLTFSTNLSGAAMQYLSECHVSAFTLGSALLCMFFAKQIKPMLILMNKNSRYINRTKNDSIYQQVVTRLRITGNMIPSSNPISSNLVGMFNKLSGSNLPLEAISTAKGATMISIYIVNTIVVTRVTDPVFIHELNQCVIYFSRILFNTAPSYKLFTVNAIPSIYFGFVTVLLSILVNYTSDNPLIPDYNTSNIPKGHVSMEVYYMYKKYSAQNYIYSNEVPTSVITEPYSFLPFVQTILGIGELYIDKGIPISFSGILGCYVSFISFHLARRAVTM